MSKRASSQVAVAAALLLTLASGCGGGEDDVVADVTVTTVTPDAASAPAESAAGEVDEVLGAAGPVDVCALLSPADGAEVAAASGLGGDVNATSTFSVDATPEPTSVAVVLGACRFEVYYAEQGSTDRVFSGTMVIQAMAADDFGLFYGGGTAVPGLGDEAYSDLGSTVMRVGGVMLSVGENSLSEDFVQAMFAKMAPNLA